MIKEQEKSQKDNPMLSLNKLIDELFHKYKWSEEKRITYIDRLSLAHLMDFTKFLKENLQNDNPMPSLDKLKCPRVLLRLECEKCGYPASEALYTNDDKYCHGINPKDIICKHDLQNDVETNKE